MPTSNRFDILSLRASQRQRYGVRSACRGLAETAGAAQASPGQEGGARRSLLATGLGKGEILVF